MREIVGRLQRETYRVFNNAEKLPLGVRGDKIVYAPALSGHCVGAARVAFPEGRPEDARIIYHDPRKPTRAGGTWSPFSLATLRPGGRAAAKREARGSARDVVAGTVRPREKDDRNSTPEDFVLDQAGFPPLGTKPSPRGVKKARQSG
jgi:hypothetical protein